MIPFQDLSRLHSSIRGELDDAIAAVIDSSAFVGESVSRSFELAFAEAHGVAHCVGCGSGTDALALALVALGVGAGDEVIVPAMTFVATAEAVVHAGATPVIADVNSRSLHLDQKSVAAVRTDRTRAVLPVHLYGSMVDPEEMKRWQAEGLLVVEDAAQAHLAHHRGTGVGVTGDAACFSFYPGKNLGGVGDGGAILTSDPTLADRLRTLRDHGRIDKYRHGEIGWCSRLDGIQAAVLEVKLRHLPAWTESRRSLANRYREGLPGLLVPWTEGSVHHLLVARVPRERRDDLGAALNAIGIATGSHYPVALSQQPALSRWARSTPNAELAASEVISLPLDPLMTTREVDIVIEALKSQLQAAAVK